MAFTATTPTGASFSSPSEWYEQYLADLTALGGTLAQEEYVPYQGPRVAEWTPDQQAAFAGVRDAQGMWQPYVDPALESLYAGQGGLGKMQEMITGASGFNRYAQGQINPATGRPYVDTDLAPVGAAGQGSYAQFWDVYKDPVQQMQDAARSIGSRNFENTTLKQLSDAFTGTGQFGSGRHQILGADAAAQAETQIQEAMATIGMQGRQNAMQDYLKWGQQGLQGASQMGTFAANQAKMGTDLMNFGLGTQQAAMADAAALGNIGTQQQQMNQQNLNLAYQDFQEQQAYPWQQLDKWSQLTRGQQIPNYQSQVTLPPTVPATYQNPWLSGIQGGAGGWQLGSSFSG